MKVLVDARNLGSRPSGIGMYAYNFISALMEYRDVEIHVLVDVIESTEIKILNESEGIAVHAYGRSISKNIAVYQYFGFVQKMINAVKPDVFWETNNLVPIRIKNPYGKYIVTIHDVFPLTMPESYKRFYPIYYKHGVRRTISDCDGIIYNSKTTKEAVEKAFPHAKQKISFVSYIIIPPIPEMQVEKKDYFLYVGNLEKRKGTDLLLKAYDRYVANGGKRKLVIAGKICENDIGELLNEKAGKIDTLQYMGYMSGTEKDRLYRECGCFVFPSRAEGFGMPIVEALQCGKTVIASNLPIFKEVAPDGIAYFEISGGESAAIEKFAETMEAYDNNRIVKENKYENRYAPDSLSGPLYDFLNYSTEYR